MITKYKIPTKTQEKNVFFIIECPLQNNNNTIQNIQKICFRIQIKENFTGGLYKPSQNFFLTIYLNIEVKISYFI